MESIDDDRVVRFGRYRLHPTEGLARGTRVIHVTQKALSVLRLLAEHPGRVVTKTELFDRVWPGVAVSDAALTSCIRELRRALADDARAPKFIETLHRRGFRFVAPISAAGIESLPVSPVADEQAVQCFGRERPLADLTASLAAAGAGARQLVIIEGEPGIGKTTLVEKFLAGRSEGTAVLIAHAACTEHDGPGEPYRPMLDALMRVCRSGPSQSLLRRCAPTWLAQMPALQMPGERQRLERRAAGVTQNRMSRELTDFLEVLASDRIVVLWLDDSQWADPPTLHWLWAFISRRDHARVLIIITLRRDENVGAAQLAAEAALKSWCRHIRLEGLDKNATRDLIGLHWGRADAGVVGAAERIHAVTEGHPLFITAILDELQTGDADHPSIVDHAQPMWLLWERHGPAIPHRLRDLIEHQIARLSLQDAALLEIASLMTAVEWSAAAVAAGADEPLPVVEGALARLTSRGVFVRRTGAVAWPDGTIAESFAFRHAIHREVLRDRVPAGRRTHAHRRIGRRMEQAFGGDTAAVALPLAAHFEASSDWERAAQYHGQAAATANTRGAVEEASRSLSRALAALERLPASPSRDSRELELRMMLGATLMATRGWGAPDVQEAYRRASELGERLEASPQRFPAYWGLWLFRWGRGELAAARDLTRTLRQLATNVPDPMLHLQVDHAQWATSFCLGQFDATLSHADRGWASCHGETADTDTLRYGNHHPGVCARSFAARALAVQGRSAEAILAADEAVAEARRFEHPFTLALALVFGAATHQTLRAAAAVLDRAQEAAEISLRHGFPLILAWAEALTGWASLATGESTRASAVVREAVDSALATGSGQFRTFNLALLAEAHYRAGDVPAALATLDHALTWVRGMDERCYEAELHRLTGEIGATASPSSGRPAASFEQGLAIARAQGAHLFALRNAVGLAEIWLTEGKHTEARSLVQDVLHSVPDAPAGDRETAQRVL
jgi:DNA-binding winged helix-turn-helix (wHTH) protein/tetratricopeptide (TPR) repeat protein